MVGTVVEVKPGYARNFLVPKGMALYMGEGPFRKVLPILHQGKKTQQQRITPVMIKEEMEKYLTQKPMVC
jgi:ribosomal protein L9